MDKMQRRGGGGGGGRRREIRDGLKQMRARGGGWTEREKKK